MLRAETCPREPVIKNSPLLPLILTAVADPVWVRLQEVALQRESIITHYDIGLDVISQG